MGSEAVLYEVAEHVALITLNRPARPVCHSEPPKAVKNLGETEPSHSTRFLVARLLGMTAGADP